MNAIDRLGLLAELDHACCELNHGVGTKCEDYPAADFIVLPFGHPEDMVTAVASRELVIPVCAECLQALMGEEWTLLYCFECGASQWVYRPLAKNRYRHHIMWLRGCPDCTNKFGGLYFNDFEGVVAADVEFVTNRRIRNAA